MACPSRVPDQLFDGQRDLLGHQVVAADIEVGGRPLRRPHVVERPRAEERAGHVHDLQRAVRAVLERAVTDRFGPVPELLVRTERPLERDVLVLRRARTLDGAGVGLRLGLLDDFDLVAEPAGVREEPFDAVVELDHEPGTDQFDVFGFTRRGDGHVRLLVPSRRPQADVSLIWAMRKITNSAGFTGAMPTSTTTLPMSIDSGGLVSASHLTKNACSAVAPNSAPSRHRPRRKALMVRLSPSHSDTSLGSNTAYCVPFMI